MGEDGIGAGAYAPQHSSNPVLTPYSVAASSGLSVGASCVEHRAFPQRACSDARIPL